MDEVRVNQSVRVRRSSLRPLSPGTLRKSAEIPRQQREFGSDERGNLQSMVRFAHVACAAAGSRNGCLISRIRIESNLKVLLSGDVRFEEAQVIRVQDDHVFSSSRDGFGRKIRAIRVRASSPPRRRDHRRRCRRSASTKAYPDLRISSLTLILAISASSAATRFSMIVVEDAQDVLRAEFRSIRRSGIRTDYRRF